MNHINHPRDKDHNNLAPQVWQKTWPTLLTDDIDIVLVDLDAIAHHAHHWLSSLNSEEQTRAHHYHFAIHRQRFIAARMVLRLLLGHYLEVAPETVLFEYGPFGKPTLQNNRYTLPLTFNLSHSNALALFAFAKQINLGIDIEHHGRHTDYLGLAERFFAPAEFTQLLSVPESDRMISFFNAWTRKEAFIKAIGEGLNFPLEQFVVSLCPDDEPQILSIKGQTTLANAWHLWNLQVAEDYTAALVVESEKKELKLRCFSITSLLL